MAKVKNTHHWGQHKARERYADGGGTDDLPSNGPPFVNPFPGTRGASRAADDQTKFSQALHDLDHTRPRLPNIQLERPRLGEKRGGKVK